MSEQKLRDLLRQAVPDAPNLDSATIERRARRDRRNKVAVVAGGVAALAIAAGTLAAPGLRGDDDARPTPGDVATQPDSSERAEFQISPYGVPPCPARLPDPKRANSSVTDLDDVVAVRLCPDGNPRREANWQPTSELLAELEAADALVDNVANFTDELRGLPVGLPEYCATDEGSYSGQFLAFYSENGTRMLVAAPGCDVVKIEGRQVHSEEIRKLYLAALDRQRDDLAYTHPFEGTIACTSPERGGPIRPGRERLVVAVTCDPPRGLESIPLDLQPTELNATQLTELNKAWAPAGWRHRWRRRVQRPRRVAFVHPGGD